jgi:hypothetical protein
MSRRRDRGGDRAPGEAGASGSAPGRRPPRISFLAQAGILVAVFAIGTLIAEAAGAANLGVALGVGQICFAIALVAVIVKT